MHAQPHPIQQRLLKTGIDGALLLLARAKLFFLHETLRFGIEALVLDFVDAGEDGSLDLAPDYASNVEREVSKVFGSRESEGDEPRSLS